MDAIIAAMFGETVKFDSPEELQDFLFSESSGLMCLAFEQLLLSHKSTELAARASRAALRQALPVEDNEEGQDRLRRIIHIMDGVQGQINEAAQEIRNMTRSKA